MSIESVVPSNHLILCYPLLLLPSVFPASGSFPVSQFFPSGSPSIGVWASALVLPMNIQDWFPLGWTGLISLQSKGLSSIFSNTTVQKHQSLSTQLSFSSNSHPYVTTGKTIALTRWTFIGKVISLLFNMLSRLVIAFLPRSKHLLISVIICSDFGTQVNKVYHCFYCFPIYCHEVIELDAMILVFWMLSFSFFTLLFHFHQEGGNICISIADSYWCMTESKAIL